MLEKRILFQDGNNNYFNKNEISVILNCFHPERYINEDMKM